MRHRHRNLLSALKFELKNRIFLLVLVVSLAASSAYAVSLLESGSLSEPTISPAEVVPQEVLDSLTLPEKPPRPMRVATRDDLKWRPGLDKPSEDGPAKEIQQQAENQLKKLESGPSLIPAGEPKSEPKPSQPKAEVAPVESPVSEAQKTPKRQSTTKQSVESARKKTPAKSEKQAAPKQAKPTPPVAKKEPPAPLPRNLKLLRSRLRTVLSYYYRKPLNNVEHDPWEVMHSMLSYELYSRVLDGGPRGKSITAVGYLCFNKSCERKRMLFINEAGDIDARIGVGLQGHKGQFMAMLAQCNVSPDYPIRVDDKDFTIQDLIQSEQKTCKTRTELTFKLMGLGHYLDSDASWQCQRGETWDIPRLIREERTQQIRGAACGGTHRLAGLSLAHRRREARGEPVDGEYLEAANFTKKYVQYAFRLQNRDGSFSTEWFRGRGAEEDIERRIRTSGHTLEWLLYELPDEELRSNKVVRAVNYLTNLLANYGKQDWHKGSLAHALHALVLYDKRVFQPQDGIDPDAGSIIATIDPSATKYRGYAMYRGVMRGRSQPKEEESYFGFFGRSSRH